MSLIISGRSCQSNNFVGPWVWYRLSSCHLKFKISELAFPENTTASAHLRIGSTIVSESGQEFAKFMV